MRRKKTKEIIVAQNILDVITGSIALYGMIKIDEAIDEWKKEHLRRYRK